MLGKALLSASALASLMHYAEARESLSCTSRFLQDEDVEEYPVEECIYINAAGEAAMLLYWNYLNGAWVEDLRILDDKWEYGMDVRAVTYCVDEEREQYKSLQFSIGYADIYGDEEFVLQRHGGEGGKCNKWVLDENDFIGHLEVFFDPVTGFIIKINVETWNGVKRTIGKGTGPSVSYWFSDEKEMIGILSYEIDGDTFVFGTYDSYCNHFFEAPEPPADPEMAEEDHEYGFVYSHEDHWMDVASEADQAMDMSVPSPYDADQVFEEELPDGQEVNLIPPPPTEVIEEEYGGDLMPTEADATDDIGDLTH